MSRPPDRVEAIIARELADVETYKGGAGQDLTRLWRNYLKPYWLHLAAAMVLVVMHAAAPLGFPLTARYLVDDVLQIGASASSMSMDLRVRCVLLVFGLNCGIWTVIILSQWLSRRLIIATGQDLVYSLRRDLHEKLQQLHVGYFERTPPGKVMSRLLDDVNVIHRWSTTHFVMLIRSACLIVIGMAMMLWLNWRLTAIVVLVLPIYGWVYRTFKPKVRRAHIAMRRLNANMYALTAERVRGIRVVKAFAVEARELRRFASLVFDHVRVGLRVVLYNYGMGLAAVAISSIATGAALYVLFAQVRDGAMSLGSALAYMSVIRYVFTPVASLASMLTMLQAFYVVLGRVLRLLDESVDVVPGAIHLEGMKGKITFDHVTFTYPEHDAPAVHDIAVKIRAGEKVALMGPSGSGKSTIFHLLMRFYDPQQGSVRVGGVDLVEADPGSVRRHVRMVQQEPVIFSGTIADNIAYGFLDARPVQIMRAAQASELHEFIMSQPVKYETTVGENGVTLSGGQKQRLALATALLTDPEVLLLDDTTSALDSKTEARIRATLNKALKDRTSIIITQRIATARDCDRIIVMERGRITQMGTHQALSQQDGFYKRICEQQEAV